MKVALLLTGYPRSHKVSRHNIKSLFIDKYDTDIFIALNSNNKNSLHNTDVNNMADDINIKEVLDFYNPIDSVIFNSYDSIFMNDMSKLDDNAKNMLPLVKFKNLFEQFYIVKKAYELLLNHVKRTGTHYDIVMRVRLDTIIVEPHRLSQIKNMNISSTLGNVDESVIETIKNISESMDLNLHIPKSNEICVDDWDNIQPNVQWTNEHIWGHSAELSPIMYEYYDELFGIINEVSLIKIFLLIYPYSEIFFSRFIELHNLKLVKNEFKIRIIR